MLLFRAVPCVLWDDGSVWKEA